MIPAAIFDDGVDSPGLLWMLSSELDDPEHNRSQETKPETQCSASRSSHQHSCDQQEARRGPRDSASSVGLDRQPDGDRGGQRENLPPDGWG